MCLFGSAQTLFGVSDAGADSLLVGRQFSDRRFELRFAARQFVDLGGHAVVGLLQFSESLVQS